MAIPFYIIANWKSNKTIAEAASWIENFSKLWKAQAIPPEIKVILCPSFLHLSTLTKSITAEMPFVLGSQDISPFGSGSFTGAISGEMLKNVIQYSIIGHSERRKYFKETDEELLEKVICSKEVGIEPIYCIPSTDAVIPSQIKIVGYEPVWAIGSGKSESAEAAAKVASTIRTKIGNDGAIIYGGSVTSQNIKEYRTAGLNGVLVGKASLDPQIFIELIHHAF